MKWKLPYEHLYGERKPRVSRTERKIAVLTELMKAREAVEQEITRIIDDPNWQPKQRYPRKFWIKLPNQPKGKL